MAFFSTGKSVFAGGGDPERISGALVSANFFSVMGVGPFATDDHREDSSGQKESLSNGKATPEYFKAMGIPLLRGRFFDEADVVAFAQPASIAVPEAPPVVIINDTMARRYWPDKDPIGHKFRLLDPNFRVPGSRSWA